MNLGSFDRFDLNFQSNWSQSPDFGGSYKRRVEAEVSFVNYPLTVTSLLVDTTKSPPGLPITAPGNISLLVKLGTDGTMAISIWGLQANTFYDFALSIDNSLAFAGSFQFVSLVFASFSPLTPHFSPCSLLLGPSLLLELLDDSVLCTAHVLCQRGAT